MNLGDVETATLQKVAVRAIKAARDSVGDAELSADPAVYVVGRDKWSIAVRWCVWRAMHERGASVRQLAMIFPQYDTTIRRGLVRMDDWVTSTPLGRAMLKAAREAVSAES